MNKMILKYFFMIQKQFFCWNTVIKSSLHNLNWSSGSSFMSCKQVSYSSGAAAGPSKIFRIWVFSEFWVSQQIVKLFFFAIGILFVGEGDQILTRIFS